MNVYVWQRIARCSDEDSYHYHKEGGVVVFAPDEESARRVAASRGAQIADDEAPTEVRAASGEEAAFLFPDAGCC